MRIAVTGGNGLVGSSIKAIAHQYPEFKFTSLQDGLKETYEWF